MSTIIHERTPEQIKLDEKILKRVKRGLALLEKEHGPGWEDKIDLETLNMRSGFSCVLGQLYDGQNPNGYYYAADHLLAGNQSLAYRHGFNVKWTNPDHVNEEYWDKLQSAWEEVLTPKIKR